MSELFIRGLATSHRFVEGDRIFQYLVDSLEVANESLQSGDVVCSNPSEHATMVDGRSRDCDLYAAIGYGTSHVFGAE